MHGSEIASWLPMPQQAAAFSFGVCVAGLMKRDPGHRIFRLSPNDMGWDRKTGQCRGCGDQNDDGKRERVMGMFVSKALT